MTSSLGYCVMTTMISVGATFGQLRAELGTSATVTALHGSTFGVGMFAAGLFGNRLVHRIGRARAFYGACLLVVVGLALYCVGRSVAITLPGAVIGGQAAAMIAMIQPGLIAEHFGVHRSRAFTAVNAAPAIAAVLTAVAIGGAINAGWSWRPVLFGMALAFCAATFIAGSRTTLPVARSVQREFAPRRLLVKATRRGWREVVLATIVEFPIGVWATVYLKEIGGSSPGAAPILAAAGGVAMFASRLVMPWMLRRFGPNLREIALVCVGLGALGLWAAPHLWLQVAAIAAIGFAAGPLFNTSVDRFHAIVPNMNTETFGALCSLATGLAVSIGPLALGVIADAVGLHTAILTMPLVAFIVFAIARRMPAQPAVS